MTTRAQMTAVERAEYDLDNDRVTFAADVLDRLGITESEVTNQQMEELDKLARQLIRKAQNVVVDRIKTKAAECRAEYENSGADQTIDADTWDDAVQAADPSEYDVFWMRTWTP